MNGIRDWRDVRALIRQRILDREIAPGEQFPRDADIAAELGCARSTVHRAMRSLADDGIVERRRRGGTRLRPLPSRNATLHIPIHRLDIEGRGWRYEHALLSRRQQRSPREVTQRLRLPRAEPCLHVRALHLADGRPWLYENRWISLVTVPEILDVDLTTTSANEWLVQHRPYDDCVLAFEAVNADTETAEALGIDTGCAVLVTERSTWIDGSPITSVRTVAAPGYRLEAEVS